MKKMIVVLVFVMSLIGVKVSAAGEENVNREAIETFKNEFPGAEFANWEKVGESDLFRVRFVYDNQGFVAFFNERGELVASLRLVTRASLPYKVSQVVRKVYSDEDIAKIEELTMGGEHSYFFTINRDEESIVLRVYPDGHIQKIENKKVKSIEKKYAKR